MSDEHRECFEALNALKAQSEINLAQMKHALLEVTDATKPIISEVLSLRASNAALKQEVESLKVCVGQRNDSLSDLQNSFGEVCEELKRFKDWQPSDPGTKEAMRCAAGQCSHPDDDYCQGNSGPILAHALRAAMVRLEEAEKDRDAAREGSKGWSEKVDYWRGILGIKPGEGMSEAIIAQAQEIKTLRGAIESWKREENDWKEIEKQMSQDKVLAENICGSFLSVRTEQAKRHMAKSRELESQLAAKDRLLADQAAVINKIAPSIAVLSRSGEVATAIREELAEAERMILLLPAPQEKP